MASPFPFLIPKIPKNNKHELSRRMKKRSQVTNLLKTSETTMCWQIGAQKTETRRDKNLKQWGSIMCNFILCFRLSLLSLRFILRSLILPTDNARRWETWREQRRSLSKDRSKVCLWREIFWWSLCNGKLFGGARSLSRKLVSNGFPANIN